MLLVLLSLTVVGVSSQTCREFSPDHLNQYNLCNKCFVNSETKAASAPELLWATSHMMVLRSRSCDCWCLDKQDWYFRNVTEEDYVMEQRKLLRNCSSKESCAILGTPKSKLLVHTSFYDYIKKESVLSEGIRVNFCPVTPPSPPREVTCRSRGVEKQVRWLYEGDRSCRSYTQFIVRTEYKNKTGKWMWLGEVSPYVGGRSTPTFGGDVDLCPDNSTLLCAYLTGAVDKVQLGVRRKDADNTDEMTSKVDFVECSKYDDPDTQMTAPTAALSSCDHWRVMALALLWVLVITTVMLPLAFITGRRYQKNNSASWRHLSEDNFAQFRSDNSISNDGPPGYTYEYANGLPLRPPLPPPLPPLRTHSPSPYEDVSDMFGKGTQSPDDVSSSPSAKWRPRGDGGSAMEMKGEL